MSAIHKLEPRGRFKDEDGEFESFDSINIKQASNGWVVTTSYEDGSEITEVFDNDGSDNGDLQAVKAILESMGVEDKVKIKEESTLLR